MSEAGREMSEAGERGQETAEGDGGLEDASVCALFGDTATLK